MHRQWSVRQNVEYSMLVLNPHALVSELQCELYLLGVSRDV